MSRGTTSLTVEDRVARLKVTNPPLNILSNDVRKAMLSHVTRLHEQPEISVVIVESEGDVAFSAGSDIREFPVDETGGIAKIRYEQHLLNRIADLPQVTIARLRGHVLGGGAELMLACDLRIADTTARFAFPEIGLGALPAAGGMKRLVRDVGPVRAAQMIMTGQPISAEEALAFGILNRVVDASELDDIVATSAGRLAGAPSDALRLAKRCIAAVVRDSAIDTIEAEAFAELYRGRNLREGVAAFLAKRKADFNQPA